MSSRWLRSLAILCVCAVLPAGCSRDKPASWYSRWESVELPGFSVVFPPGDVVKNDESPSQGRYARKVSGSYVAHWLDDVIVEGSVSASWSTQAPSRDEWTRTSLSLYIQGMKLGLADARVLKEMRVGPDRWLAIIGSERVPLAVGTVRCEDGFAIDFTYARYHDPVRQADDMRALLRSVRCHVSDLNRATMVISTRLPDGFGLVTAHNPQLYRSLDGESLGLNFSAGNIQKDKKIFTAVIKAMFSSVEGEITDSNIATIAVPRVLHLEPTSLVLVVMPKTHEGLYVGAVYCKEIDLTLMSVWTAPHVTDAVAIQRLSQVGCPDTPSTPTPSFDSVVDAACRSGNAAACELRTTPGT